jgi:hypothetical protein
LAHLFDDNTSKAELVFELGMKPHDYGNCATFRREVDLSVAGMVQDCAECHVGGGAMEYVPAPTMDGRIALRDITTENVNTFGSPITDGNFTAWNYFIDVYDVDRDDDRREVLYMDWQKTGVMEMDCLLCHLEGYDYDARIHMLRDAKFDASRAVGAGVAAPNTVAWDDNGYGKNVTYNNLVEEYDESSNATFNSAVLMNIKAAPPSENCAFCHANWPGVDWKKRGDSWRNERTDAHYVLQCMGCHQGKVGSVIGISGNATAGPDYKDLGQCDPAKGWAPYSSNWNPKDKSVKTCEDCHLRAGYDKTLKEYSPDYGAPDPTGKHQAYGLLGVLCKTDMLGSGTNANHLDIIDCAACHVRKISGEAWNTGGAIVDASGPDHSGYPPKYNGRLTDHENEYVLRNMEENLCYTWWGGKIIPASTLTTIFWRDDNATVDINLDGDPKGMDVPLAVDVLQTDIENNWTTMSMDNLGIIDADVIQDRINELVDDLGGDIKLCALVVPFRLTHNVSPAIYALGHSCSDCHDSTGSKGLWNGQYKLQGDQMTLSYNGTGHTPSQVMAKYTTVTSRHGGAQNTDFHFNLKQKDGKFSIPVVPFSGGSDNLTAVYRYELLYADNITACGCCTDVDGNPYSTRAGWVKYLNDITEPIRTWPDANVTVTGQVAGPYDHTYPNRPGCNATNSTGCWRLGNTERPGCNETNQDNCQILWDMYDVEIFHSLTFTAVDVGDGASYMWNFNDGTGSATGISVPHTFNTLGVYKVVLTVVDAWGIVDPQMIMVNVKRP